MLYSCCFYNNLYKQPLVYKQWTLTHSQYQGYVDGT